MSKANEKKLDARKISRKLNPRQRKFIAHYTDPTNKETFGNGTRSAIAAGPKSDEKAKKHLDSDWHLCYIRKGRNAGGTREE